MRALFCLVLVFASLEIVSQNDSSQYYSKRYIIITQKNVEFIGEIIRQDAREVLIKTDKLGEVAIPKYEIKEMKEVESREFTSTGTYIPEELFATRYFITTNGLPLKKGDSYVIWNLWGPDFQFGISNNFSAGIMTSWFGVPIIASLKYSVELTEELHLGIGTLLGSGSWSAPGLLMTLPFGSLTFGDRRNNVSISGGYGAVYYQGITYDSPLLSVGGMAKLTKTLSFIFDSVILPDINGETISNAAVVIPAIRVQKDDNKAFQIAFGGIVTDTQSAPIPFPMLQWYRKL